MNSELDVLAEENLRLKAEVNRLSLDNRNFAQLADSLKRQEESLRLELLKERLWRISFQMAYLQSLEERTRRELDALEKEHRGGVREDGEL